MSFTTLSTYTKSGKPEKPRTYNVNVGPVQVDAVPPTVNINISPATEYITRPEIMECGLGADCESYDD